MVAHAGALHDHVHVVQVGKDRILQALTVVGADRFQNIRVLLNDRFFCLMMDGEQTCPAIMYILRTGMLVGTTSMTMSGGSFNGYAPSATLLEAPWAYNSEEDVQAMCESDIGKGIMQDFEDAGFKVLWYQLRGPRELTSNVPINKASDLQGRKMRMSGNVLHNSMWTAAGAITSAIALSETFNALSQGVVEMQENPYDMIYDNSFYEVQKYVNQTNHVYSTIFNLLSVDIWNGLSEDQQNIITETSNEMQDWTNEYYFAHKDEYLEKLKETGMQVNEDVDRDDIKNAMMPAIEEFLKSQPGDLWTTYQAICDLSNS